MNSKTSSPMNSKTIRPGRESSFVLSFFTGVNIEWPVVPKLRMGRASNVLPRLQFSERLLKAQRDADFVPFFVAFFGGVAFGVDAYENGSAERRRPARRARRP